MACIRRGDGTYDYKFERNRAPNSGAEADNDADGSSGVLVITREDIIENINKNPKMTRTEKRLTRASVKKRFDLEVRMEAKRRGYTDRSKAVRRASRAIRRGDNPDNWRRVLGDVLLYPEDPYSSEGVYSEEGLKHAKAGRGQGSGHEEDKAVATSGPAEKDKAVATSGSVEEDNAVATSDPTTMQGEAGADLEHKDDQASTAVAVSASAEKPAMGLVSATSSLNTNELTWVIDTGATSHMCNDIGLFVTFEPLESSMETAANPLRILGKGTVRFPVKDATNAVRSVELKDVNYVPRVAHNLLSVIKALVNDGFKININKRECTLRHDGGGYVLSAPGGGGVDLYLLRGIGKRECALLANGNVNTKEALRWHRRAGHPGVNAMRKAIPKTATRPGEVFHTDTGVLPTSTFSGYRYFIVFVDEYTRYVFTFLMRKRDEVYHVYEDLRRKVKEKIGAEQIRELSASEAMDNQALPRTSEVIGASEASAAFGEQRTGASQLEQPIQAGRAQVGETLLPVIIESGDDRTVVPQRAVSPRSREMHVRGLITQVHGAWKPIHTEPLSETEARFSLTMKGIQHRWTHRGAKQTCTGSLLRVDT
ncbi:unnamed protein product [Phytophthora fragariaefolia]|uniref:Unnamed protein product n=1 Tax=Phytophthora fragariaefolia TaxID=1490495 RepID=A0A9W6YEW2_9STRA|nr:unnamed protein product [Phytophthora fragariaefolia]